MQPDLDRMKTLAGVNEEPQQPPKMALVIDRYNGKGTRLDIEEYMEFVAQYADGYEKSESGGIVTYNGEEDIIVAIYE